MAKFQDIDQGFQTQLKAEESNSFDKVHSGQSLYSVATEQTLKRQQYFGDHIQTINMAADEMKTEITSEVVRTHAPGTQSLQTTLAPTVNKTTTLTGSRTYQYHTRSDHLVTHSQQENIMMHQHVETHDTTFTHLVPTQESVGTPSKTHVGGAEMHVGQQALMHGGVLQQTDGLAHLNGSMRHISANLIGMSGKKVVISP